MTHAPREFRVAILTGADSDANRRCIEAIAVLPGVRIAAILLDTARPRLQQRIRNFRRNVRREGWKYPFTRLADACADALDALAVREAPASEVDALLRHAFPNENFSLEDITARHSIPLLRAGNLNGAAAAAMLADTHADLGVVIGTRVLKRTTFGIPRLGSINIHKGKVPEYRGLPPGFWELFEGADRAGVSVHMVDDGLDTGAVLAEDTIPIHRHETLASLQTKLDARGVAVLADAVAAMASGTATARPQPSFQGRARTWPTRAQRAELAARTGEATTKSRSAAHRIVKNLWHLALFHGGAVALLRRLRRRSRGAILLYHRVNDVSADVLTTSRRRFAEHLVCMRRYYEVRPSAWMVDRIAARVRIRPTTVAIHFDDCYADVYECAAPLLLAAGLPATSFVSSGYVGTDRRFAHDDDSPFEFRNMTAGQVAGLGAFGVDVGSHTVNHPDMGVAGDAVARHELEASKAALEAIVGAPVDVFSFPYGQPCHFRADGAAMAHQTGYRAIFSASGGFVGQRTSPSDIPRFGVSEGSLPLYLLFEIEGLSISGLRRHLLDRVSRARLHDRKPVRTAHARTATP